MNAKRSDKIATVVLYAIAAIIVIILSFLLLYILIGGLPHVSWHFLTSPSQTFMAGGGIRDQLWNSFYLLILTLMISFPLSLGAGIYLSEYANQKSMLTNIVRTAIEILSSLPSIVVGLFGMILFVQEFKIGYSVFAGALALTVFNLPLMTRNIEQSLKAVPHIQREGGLALGLSRWETVIHVVIPEAVPGIVTGIILSAGRVFGEAAALIYTAGSSTIMPLDWSNWNIFSNSSPIGIFRTAESLAVHIWAINTEAPLSDGAAISAASGAVLIIFVLIFNFSARFFGNLIHKKLTSAD